MNEPYLTIAEINAKYPNQWVLLANPTLTRLHEVRGGHVLFHTADRLELYRWFEALPDDPAVREFASWYTGPRDAVELEREQQGAA
jgi:hypothetical protein